MSVDKLAQAFERDLVQEVLLRETRPTVHCVLTVYRTRNLQSLRRARDRLAYRLHRILFRGRRYGGIPTFRLIHGFAAVETTTSPHLHMLMSVEHGIERRLEAQISRLWRSISPTGTVHFEWHRGSTEDSIALAWYITKDTDQVELRDSFVCLGQLLPKTAGPIKRLTAEERASEPCALCKEAAQRVRAAGEPPRYAGYLDVALRRDSLATGT